MRRRTGNAEAVSIYIRDGNKLNFVYTQNDTFPKNFVRVINVYIFFSILLDEENIGGMLPSQANPLTCLMCISRPRKCPAGSVKNSMKDPAIKSIG